MRLAAAIGIMILSLFSSFVIVLVGASYPSLLAHLSGLVKSIHSENVLMRIMLSFLLFAGALHVNIRRLQNDIGSIICFATVGVLIPTAWVGALMYFLFALFSVKVAFIYCLLFGALISPTDPSAVLGILRTAQVEVLITVAMVMGGYLLASVIHVFGPLAMVVAGTIMGNIGKLARRLAGSSTERKLPYDMSSFFKVACSSSS